MEKSEIEKLAKRIEELDTKSTQVLTFLSFVIIADATLGNTVTDPGRKLAFTSAMRCWLWALYPVILGILPVRELRSETVRWYRTLHWLKFILLWIAAFFISLGLYRFARVL
jgi:hypothetical protein